MAESAKGIVHDVEVAGKSHGGSGSEHIGIRRPCAEGVVVEIADETEGLILMPQMGGLFIRCGEAGCVASPHGKSAHIQFEIQSLTAA